MPREDSKRAALGARSRIYRHLYESHEHCTRQLLAEQCGISMPTLYQNLNELMDEGLVCDSGEEQSTGGRKARGLDIVMFSGYKYEQLMARCADEPDLKRMTCIAARPVRKTGRQL